jgi:hypothetical protein
MIIGICGLKSSGKSTLAGLLCDKKGFVRLAFAEPIRDMLHAFLLYQGASYVTIDRILHGDLKEEASPYFNGKTYRHVIQTLGTEWGRQMIDENLWVSAWLKKADQYFHVVCDDVRFETEAKAIKERKGIIIRLDRKGTNVGDQHRSETEIQSIQHNYTIVNDRTIDDIWEQMRLILDIELYHNKEARPITSAS